MVQEPGISVLDDDDAPDPPPRPTKSRRAGLLVGILLGSMLAVVSGLAAFYAGWLERTLTDVRRDDQAMPSEYPGRPADSPAKNTPLNVVVMGSDARDPNEPGRSDVLIIAHLTGARDKAYLISFPRDMWVEIPGHGKAKINAAYSWGGSALTIRTLESLTGTRMDHLAKVDFEGFVSLTDTLGGVTVFNKYASSRDGCTWPYGMITLKGQCALTYVRQRYELPNGDLDRAERQRSVLKAMILKIATPEILSNPARFAELMDRLAPLIVFDAGLTNGQVRDVGMSLRLSGKNDIITCQAPISGFSAAPDGQSIDVVDAAQMAELSTALRGDSMAAYWAKYSSQSFDGLGQVPYPR